MITERDTHDGGDRVEEEHPPLESPAELAAELEVEDVNRNEYQ